MARPKWSADLMARFERERKKHAGPVRITSAVHVSQRGRPWYVTTRELRFHTLVRGKARAPYVTRPAGTAVRVQKLPKRPGDPALVAYRGTDKRNLYVWAHPGDIVPRTEGRRVGAKARDQSPEAKRLRLRDKIRGYFDRMAKRVRATDKANVYTLEEWRARGERFGNHFPVSVAADGLINELLNYDVSELGRLVKWLDKNGIEYDQGFSWSWHFWDKDNPPDWEAHKREMGFDQ